MIECSLAVILSGESGPPETFVLFADKFLRHLGNKYLRSNTSQPATLKSVE